MIILLILIFVTVTGYDLKCPAKAEWRLRANVSCYSDSKYVCLFHLLKGKYEENCLGSDQSSIGSKLVFQPLFNLAICNADRYQPIVFTTYGNSECILRKSECAGEGQVVYSNESYSKDITCHCDYTKGYTFVSRPNNTCFCNPSMEDCSCFRVNCSNLSSDYRCITDGDIKAKTTCQEIHQQVLPNKDILTVQFIENNKHRNMRVSQSHEVSNIIILLIAVYLAIIVIAVFKSYVLVPPTIVSQETITYDQGGNTTLLKCHVQSFLPLTSASLCKVTNNECWEKKSRIVSNGKGQNTIISEIQDYAKSDTYKCKARNIIGTVESKIELPNEKEVAEPPSSTTNDEIKTIINEHRQKKTCGKHYFARVVLIGKNGVGKTSLMRRLLLGTKEQSSFTESTDGIDIKKCNINVKDGNWSPCNKIDHDLARLIQQVYTEENENKTEALEQSIENVEHNSFGQEDSSYSLDDSKAGSNQSFVLPEKITYDNQLEVSNQSSHDKTDQVEAYERSCNVGTSNFIEDRPDIDDTSVDEINRENTNCIIDDSDKNVKTMESETRRDKRKTNQLKMFEGNLKKSNEVENERGQENDENIVQMVSSVMESCLHLDTDKSQANLALCALWDFAGQKDFYATHQVFLSKCAVFLLVTDSLESSYADQLWIDFKDTAQYVRFWFDAIHCYWSNPRENRLDPPIIVVCTNEDKIKNKEHHQSEFNMNLGKILNPQKKIEHLRNIYFVSNTEDDDTVFQEIRQEISKHAMNMNDWGKQCPLKWLLFQQVLVKMKDSNVPISTTTKLKKIAKHDSIGIDNDEEFQKCLEYFHDIGSVIYIDEENLKEHVILDPKWLIDAFRCLVTDKVENIIQSSVDWQTLKENGELTPKLIDLLFKKVPKLKFVENKKHLLEVMKRFDIIVQLSNSSVLYMPCMMESCSFTIVKKKFMKKMKLAKHTSWLCLVFEFLPPAFFNHIIAWYIKQYDVSTIFDKRTLTKRNALYRQIGVFDLDSNDCKQLVVCEGPNIVALQIWNYKMYNVDRETYGKIANKLCKFINSIEKRYSMRVTYTKSFKCKDGNFTMNQKTVKDLFIRQQYWCAEHNTFHICYDILEPWQGLEEIKRGDFDRLKRDEVRIPSPVPLNLDSEDI